MLEQIFCAICQVQCLPTQANGYMTKLHHLRDEWPENSYTRWLFPC